MLARIFAARVIASVLVVALVAAACDDNSGTGQPVPRFDTTFLDFGNVDAGTSQERSFTLTNTGTGVLQGTFAQTVCDPPSNPTGTACWSLVGDATYLLTTNQSKTFTVRFAPYSVSAGGGDCGLGAGHCQIESAHGIVHCSGTGIVQ